MATGYGMITYRTAYAKKHYLTAFYTAHLNSVLDKSDRLSIFLNEAQRHNIRLLPPNINHSSVGFTMVREGEIVFGLAGIKGCGEKTVESILGERESGGPFLSIHDFCRRLPSVNVKVKEALVWCGAFDVMGDRAKIAVNIIGINKAAKAGKDISLDQLAPVEIDRIQMVRRERELTGFYISSTPMDIYWDELKRYGVQREFSTSPFCIAGIITKVRRHRSKRGEMAFVDIETYDSDMPSLVMYSNVWKASKSFCNVDDVIITWGKREMFRGEWTAVVDRCIPLRFDIPMIEGIQVDMGEADITDLMELRRIISENPGTRSIKIRILIRDETLAERLRDAILMVGPGIQISGYLISQLENMFGPVTYF